MFHSWGAVTRIKLWQVVKAPLMCIDFVRLLSLDQNFSVQLIQPSRHCHAFQEGMLELFTDIGTILRRKAGSIIKIGKPLRLSFRCRWVTSGDEAVASSILCRS